LPGAYEVGSRSKLGAGLRGNASTDAAPRTPRRNEAIQFPFQRAGRSLVFFDVLERNFLLPFVCLLIHTVLMTRNKHFFSQITVIGPLSALLFTAACGTTAGESSDDTAGEFLQELAANVTVTGSNAADVSPTITGTGFINVVNNGDHVAVTETGSGTINIVNDGGILNATNTGNGVMTINSTATGEVSVTNTGDGRVTVNATGSAPVTVTHTGNGDFTFP
jgi:putative autotransporter adhesin-like protein